jgi:hypothetical protein
VLRLLYRFYDADQGSVSVGGHDVRDLRRDTVQRAIAVIPQDTVLFHETIGYNLRYGNLDASWDEVVEAAKQAQIHDAIMSFPDGYDTVVGERGLKVRGIHRSKSQCCFSNCFPSGTPSPCARRLVAPSPLILAPWCFIFISCRVGRSSGSASPAPS